MQHVKGLEAVVKEINENFEVADWYEFGKLDVQYMSQNALFLAGLKYGNYEVDFTVNGDCRFEHDGETYQTDKDLTEKVENLMRIGKIEYINNNWFELFFNGGESYEVCDEFYGLPSVLHMKQYLVSHIAQQMRDSGDLQNASELEGFRFIGGSLKPTFHGNLNQGFDVVKKALKKANLESEVVFIEKEILEGNMIGYFVGAMYYSKNDEAIALIEDSFVGWLCD